MPANGPNIRSLHFLCPCSINVPIRANVSSLSMRRSGGAIPANVSNIRSLSFLCPCSLDLSTTANVSSLSLRWSGGEIHYYNFRVGFIRTASWFPRKEVRFFTIEQSSSSGAKYYSSEMIEMMEATEGNAEMTEMMETTETTEGNAEMTEMMETTEGNAEMTEMMETTEGNAENSMAPLVLFDFSAYMASKVKAVNEALDFAVPLQYPEKIYEPMRYALFGGKMKLLSMLSIAACELFGGEQETVMPLACAMEMIHDSSLVHGDLPCMVNSDLRRGRPTAPAVYGASTAVLTGDALICKSFEHIAKATKGVSSENVLRVIARLGKSVGARGVLAGQFVDFQSSRDPSVTLQTLEFIHLHKSAILVECSLVCGAIVGGASDEDIERLEEHGRTLGMLFKMVDDLLYVTKTTDEELGKPAGSDDVLTHKATYPKLLGLEKTKQLADELFRKAKTQISHFDPVRAAPLIAIADFIMHSMPQQQLHSVSSNRASSSHSDD